MPSTSAAAPAPDPGPLGQALVRTAQRLGAQPHIQVLDEAGGVSVTSFADSLDAAGAIAARLLEDGLRPGDPVALLSDPAPRQIQACFGIWLAGGVLTPLDPQWEPEAHGRALRKVRARFGLAPPARREGLERAARGVDGFRAIEVEEAARPGAAPARLPRVDPESRALILFTSGTTGEPKAALLSHRALGWNAATVIAQIGMDEADCILSVLPLHHVFGLLVAGLAPALTGARVTFPRSLKGPDIAAAMRVGQVTLVAAVPQLLNALDRSIEARLAAAGALRRRVVAVLRRLTSSCRRLGFNPGPWLLRPLHEAVGGRLRLLGSAGAPLDPEVALRLWSLGFNVCEAYGLTETGPAVSFDDPRRPRFGSVGRPLPGVELRIEGADGSGSGEIVVRSPSLFEGYLDAPEATAEMLRDGWVWTGDLGRVDGEGRIFITGRKREVIVLASGKNVYPHEVEARLDESPYIKESCVLGLAEQGRRGTERLHAVVVPDLDAFRQAGESRIAVTLHDEVNRIGDRLPSHHRVVGVTVRTTPLPRTPLGKLRRFQVERELLELLAGGSGEAGEEIAPGPGSPAWEAVRGALATAARAGAAVTPQASIELDLGLDSLARVEALAELERRLDQKLPDGFGAGCLTAGELLREVEAWLDNPEADGAGFAGLATAAGDADFRHWSRRLLRPFGVALIALLWLPVWLAARLLWRFRVSGREHLPRGPVLLCPNHASYADPIFLALALPWRHRARFWAIGDHEIFSHPVMWLLGRMGNVIRAQGGAGLKAMLQAGGTVLRSGAPLMLFPEGARAPRGERLEFRRGAAILSRTFGVPIVPVWLEGLDRLLPRGSWKLGFGHRVAVRFGAPLDPRDFDGAADPGLAMTRALRERVLALGEAERAAK